jgi:hypothetical protein
MVASSAYIPAGGIGDLDLDLDLDQVLGPNPCQVLLDHCLIQEEEVVLGT